MSKLFNNKLLAVILSVVLGLLFFNLVSPTAYTHASEQRISFSSTK